MATTPFLVMTAIDLNGPVFDAGEVLAGTAGGKPRQEPLGRDWLPLFVLRSD